jgi:hypothetical protein
MRHGIKIGVGCLLLALSPCCWCLFPWLTHEPPETAAVRKDAQGNVVQMIVLEQSYWTTARGIPAAHGPTSIRKYSQKYFLEEPGKPRRELTFLRDNWIGNDCRPVDKSPLWVTAGFFGSKLSVRVFDDKQMAYQRTLNCTPDLYHGGNDFRFENGNRTLVYRTAQGFEAYDVTTDAVMPWKPAKN